MKTPLERTLEILENRGFSDLIDLIDSDLARNNEELLQHVQETEDSELLTAIVTIPNLMTDELRSSMRELFADWQSGLQILSTQPLDAILDTDSESDSPSQVSTTDYIPSAASQEFLNALEEQEIIELENERNESSPSRR